MGKYHVYVKRTGVVEIIENKDDFSSLLYDLIGEDAQEYFEEATDPKTVIGGTDEDEFAEKGYCTGECICVQRTQEHFEHLLYNISAIATEAYDKMVEVDKYGISFVEGVAIFSTEGGAVYRVDAKNIEMIESEEL